MSEKLEELENIFNLAEGVLEDLEDDFDDTVEYEVIPMENTEILLEEDSNLEDGEIISLKTLREDYFFIKESIKNNVNLGKKLLDKAMESVDGDFEISPEMIESISSLLKANNLSLKDLSKIYKEIKQVEQLRNGGRSPALKFQQNNVIFKGDITSLLEEM